MSFIFWKNADVDDVADFLAAILVSHLTDGEKVLWLVPGGSSIEIAAKTSRLLPHKLARNLSVTLTDERYGPVSHADSNWEQLKSAGFRLPGAQLLPVLTGRDFVQTIDDFATLLQKQLKEADFLLGFFGLGADGHTAGILPGSPALTSQKLAAGYDATVYQRITMTPAAITQLDEAVVYAVGRPKHAALDRLAEDLPITEQPAQALKQVPKVTIFNDYKEGSI
jgi:6-phosphogluconolactonase/glucosamine-6-phosphate isomerase/deaminase